MNKKYVSLFTLIVFSVFTFSCSIYSRKTMQRERFEEISSKKAQKLYFVQVVKTNGEVIEFKWKQPGYVVKNTIVGIVPGKTGEGNIITIPFSEIKQVMYKRFNPGKTFVLVVGTVLITSAVLYLIATGIILED